VRRDELTDLETVSLSDNGKVDELLVDFSKKLQHCYGRSELLQPLNAILVFDSQGGKGFSGTDSI
jgi:hypothetical protein